MSNVSEATCTIINELGLHARAAALLVKEANRFDSEVFLNVETQEVNAKSIMGVLMLAAGIGTRVTVRCEGADSERCLEALVRLFEDRFGEER